MTTPSWFQSSLSQSLVPSTTAREWATPLTASSLLNRSASLLFIDSGVEDWQTLAAGAAAGTEIYRLSPEQDAIAQITQTLLGRENIASVQIVSHGAAGGLQLGESWLKVATLNRYAAELASWQTALAPDADILLYGCDVASNEVGKAFVSILAQLTGADVAASEDVTGNGGDWILEYQTGAIATTASDGFASYQHSLGFYAVTNTNDNGTGSLRQAILDANSTAEADTIIFANPIFNDATADTITLDGLELEITSDLTINGTNANLLTVSANNRSRVFNIGSGVVVDFNDLTIANGNALGGDGGGILNNGILTLTSSVVRDSVAAFGAGIANEEGATLTVNLSTISGNTQAGGGAGILSNGILTLVDSTVTNNTADDGQGFGTGGGIQIQAGTATIRNTTIQGNRANGANDDGGGGIMVYGGTVTIEQSTIDGNSTTSSQRGGGGIAHIGDATSQLTLFKSVVSNNTAEAGGGIYNLVGALEINDSTIADNTANAQGGGFMNLGATATLMNSDILRNTSADGGGINNNSGSDLTITDSTISDNEATAGGGIINFSRLTVSNSTVTDNEATSDGGGISNYNLNAQITIQNSNISSNRSARNGGGLSNIRGTATLGGSTIANNISTEFGGGLANEGGTVTLINSTVSGNQSTASNGGGVINTSGANNTQGQMTLVNTTVSGNQALVGGGVRNSGASTLNLTNVTIANNTATTSGGGLSTRNDSTVNIQNTIVATNNSALNPDIEGAYVDQGHNLIGNSTGSTGFTVSTLVGTAANPLDPQLEPLGNYGGTTKIHRLLSGSLAIDAGDTAKLPTDITDLDGDLDTSEAIPYDQTRFTRVVGDRVDIGAYEASPVVTLKASTAAISEGSSGQFIVSRGSDTQGALTVTLSLTGTNLSSGDYTLSVGGNAITVTNNTFTIEIPDGESSVTIDFAAIQESINAAEADEIFFLKLEKDASYLISANTTVSMTIDANGTVVTRTDDATNAYLEGSLRQAVLNSNDLTGTQDITFSLGNGPQVITLAQALSDLSDNVNIRNTTGASNLTIQVDSTLNNPFDLFVVKSGVTASFDQLTLSGGRSGILNQGTIASLSNSVLTNNDIGLSNEGTIGMVTQSKLTDSDKEGILNTGTIAAISQTTITGNQQGIKNYGTIGSLGNLTVSQNDDAGIANFGGTIGSINTSNISNNSLEGLLNLGTITTISDSRFKDNGGSGIVNQLFGKIETISSVTLDGNAEYGLDNQYANIGTISEGIISNNTKDGIFLAFGSIDTIEETDITDNNNHGVNVGEQGEIGTLRNSRVSRNAGHGIVTDTASEIDQFEGNLVSNNTKNGIVNGGVINRLINSTFSGNENGICNFSQIGDLINVTVAGNLNQSIENDGTITNLLNNLLVGNTINAVTGKNLNGITTQANNQIGSFAELGVDATLRDNDGPTETHALLPGSSAIDAAGSSATTADQRGITAVNTRDIGAFESRGFTITTTDGTPQSTPAESAFTNPLGIVVQSRFNEPVAGGTVTYTPPASGASATVSSTTATLDEFGLASVTATANDTPGTYTVSAGGNGITTPASFTLTNDNRPPVLDAIANQTTDEEQLLKFTVTGSDPDAGSQLTYSIVGTVPDGASIDATTGEFTWTPTEIQDGTTSITIQVSDGSLTDQKTFTVTVNEVNQAPTLDAIAPQTIDEGDTLQVTAQGSDVDRPAQSLSYSLVSAPTGVTINATTGELSWTPTEIQDGISSITVQVSDGSLTAQQTFQVTVNEVNQAPTLTTIAPQTANEGETFRFTVQGSDADVPAQSLSYSLISAPDGVAIDATTGELTWTPTEVQDGISSVTVQVSDGSLTAQQTFQITVKEVNQAPTLTAIANQTINEGETLRVIAQGSDADRPVQSLTYSLVNPPTGVTIDASTGELSWMPTETQDGNSNITVQVSDGSLTAQRTFQVTVREVNQAPTLAAIANQTVDENQLLNFTVTGSDADVPAQALTYSLVNAPTGATINPTTGVFSWTPSDDQNGTFNFSVQVSDGALTGTQAVTINVAPVNDRPSFTANDLTGVEDSGAQAIDNWATFNPGASNESSQTATYQVSAISNPGLFAVAPSIDANGRLTYTPATNAFGTSTFTVIVQDNGGTDKGGINQSLARQFTLTVNPRNDAPSFNANGIDLFTTAGAGEQVVANWTGGFVAGPANESDQRIAGYEVVGNNNPGLFATAPTIDVNGTLRYTPVGTLTSPGTAILSVRVRDNGGTENGGVDVSEIRQFTITVNPQPAPVQTSTPVSQPPVSQPPVSQPPVSQPPAAPPQSENDRSTRRFDDQPSVDTDTSGSVFQTRWHRSDSNSNNGRRRRRRQSSSRRRRF